MIKRKVNAFTLVFYSIGILLLTLGISLTIKANLGTSPFDALLVGLSHNIGLTVGSWEVVISFVLIFTNACLKKQKPKFLGLVTAFMTGVCIDFWLFLIKTLENPSQFLVFTVGLIIIGIGTAVYLHTNFAPIPLDHLMLIITERTGISIRLSKTVLYVTFLLLAFLLHGPIGIGTLLTVGLGGPLLQFFMPLTRKWLFKKTEGILLSPLEEKE
ncbi:YczE/YyaS/YitT family protein [Priestia endophytica]|uniref:YczE/YyaS/YitT family protein n=1 Tax=Priestia endophytica TaxID=135735 RepID=UPI002281FC98|nr:YitT family protein [Priestia endophytica]MCY8235474.1 YitT family protein [Priestia endophytica]